MALHFRELLMAVLMVTSVAYAAFGEAQELPSGAIIVTPTEFKWRGSQRGETAVLFGDPRKPGRYVQRSKWPADTINLPQHPEDKEITVISAFGILDLG